MHVAFLYCSKAFDRVSYPLMFEVLKNRGLCPVYLRLLIVLYKANVLLVKWQQECSDLFPMSNGVKQGGIISPKFLLSA